jgi:hypothetical protein
MFLLPEMQKVGMNSNNYVVGSSIENIIASTENVDVSTTLNFRIPLSLLIGKYGHT